ncbi:SCO family protein [Ralstonia solanacearum]
MTSARCTRRQALAMLIAAGITTGAQGAAALPAGSLYQSSVTLTDQDGRAFHLADLSGRPVLIGMFYSSCQMVCPMIFETIRSTLARSGASARSGVRVVMITVDPDRDSLSVLKRTATAHSAGEQWRLARADSNGTREIAALLGIQYRRLVNGDFNHSSTIVLLDANGRINARTNILGAPDPKLVSAVPALLAT